MKRKRRIRMDRVLILVSGALACVALLIGGFFLTNKLLNKEIISSKYAYANMEIKLDGEAVKSSVFSEEDEETKENLLYAFHLPELPDEKAKEELNEFIDKIKNEKAAVTHIDFESTQAFSQYKSYVVSATLYEEMDGLNPIRPIKTEKIYFNFDHDTWIDIHDCLRMKAVRALALKASCTDTQIQLMKINEDGLILDVNGQESEYRYQDHDTSFVMSNEHIPSTLKGEKIVVEKREIDPNKPMIAFTFDDGPNPGYTEQILEALEKVGGRATFFELGNRMEMYPETVKKVCASGSEVGSHSYDHTYDWMNKMTLEEAMADLDKVDDIYFSLTGNDIMLFRPPFGASIPSLKESITQKIVLWDVDTRDWESKNTQKVVEMCKKYGYDGSIVLFHDIHATTIPAAVELIEYYHSQGYQLVTVSELYEAKGK